MMKSLLAANRSEKDSFRIPHSVQQSIPVRRIFTDGIWQVGQKYSKTWRFSDINYAASSLDDRRSIFRSYGAVLNSLPTDATAKITIINRRLNPVDFQRTMLMPECSDGLDYYRGEYNQIILDKAAESNNLVQEKYITLSIGLRKIEQTRAYFRRVDTNLSASFGRLDSGAYAISCADRLRLLHDFFRPGEEASFRFDLSANIKRGIDFRDLICPDGLQFRAGYFEMGGKFGRVLFMRDYASFISDEMIKDLSDFSRNLLLSIDSLPIPTEEAVREVQSRILGVETDITRWQQRQNRQNNFTATVPYDLEQMRTESKDLLEDLTARDQRLMFACVTLVHIADSLEQLDADTQTLQSIAQEKLCGFSVLRYQQEDGIGLYSWVNDTELEDLDDYQARKLRRCVQCGAIEPLAAEPMDEPSTDGTPPQPILQPQTPEAAIQEAANELERETRPAVQRGGRKACPYCGGTKWAESTEEYEEVYFPIQRTDGSIIPGVVPKEMASETQTDELGLPVVTITEEPTRIPFYKPDIFPVILQKNVSMYGRFLGDSDIDKIADQQNTTNRVEAKIIDKLLKSGSYITLPDEASIRVDADDMKVIRPGNAATKALIDVYDLQGNVQQDLTYLAQVYEEARQVIGITDSFQGRTDHTATSGKAKEFAAAQSAQNFSLS